MPWGRANSFLLALFAECRTRTGMSSLLITCSSGLNSSLIFEALHLKINLNFDELLFE